MRSVSHTCSCVNMLERHASCWLSKPCCLVRRSTWCRASGSKHIPPSRRGLLSALHAARAGCGTRTWSQRGPRSAFMLAPRSLRPPATASARCALAPIVQLVHMPVQHNGEGAWKQAKTAPWWQNSELRTAPPVSTAAAVLPYSAISPWPASHKWPLQVTWCAQAVHVCGARQAAPVQQVGIRFGRQRGEAVMKAIASLLAARSSARRRASWTRAPQRSWPTWRSCA